MEFINKMMMKVEEKNLEEIKEEKLLKRIYKKIKKIYRKFRKGISQLIIIILNRVYSFFIPLKKNKVLFISDVRKDIGDANLAYIYNYLPDKYKKVTSFVADRRIRRTLKEKMKLVYNLSVCKYILLDDFCRFTSYIRVRKGQELVQLWHGAGAFKKFGHSRAKNEGDLQNTKIHPGYKRYTKAIVSSESIRECYSEAFNINIDKVQATGFPRTDMFFDKEKMKEKRNEILKNYPYLKNKKVILFAPTYRGTRVKDANYDFSQINLDDIYNKFKEEYVFIFKWHPALYNNIITDKIIGLDFSKYNDFYFDLSSERDINDLLLVTDILITDYSSVIFDYVFLNKPIIYYTYDLDEYGDGRGLYFPFKEYVYGEVAKNCNELIDAITKENMDMENRIRFKEKFLNACDGNSTKKTYEWIFNGKLDKVVKEVSKYSN